MSVYYYYYYYYYYYCKLIISKPRLFESVQYSHKH